MAMVTRSAFTARGCTGAYQNRAMPRHTEVYSSSKYRIALPVTMASGP